MKKELDGEVLARARHDLAALHKQVTVGEPLTPEVYNLFSYLLEEVVRLEALVHAFRRETVGKPEGWR